MSPAAAPGQVRVPHQLELRRPQRRGTSFLCVLLAAAFASTFRPGPAFGITPHRLQVTTIIAKALIPALTSSMLTGDDQYTLHPLAKGCPANTARAQRAMAPLSAGRPAALCGPGAVAQGLHHGDGAHGAAEGDGIPPQPAPEPAGGGHDLLAHDRRSGGSPAGCRAPRQTPVCNQHVHVAARAWRRCSADIHRDHAGLGGQLPGLTIATHFDVSKVAVRLRVHGQREAGPRQTVAGAARVVSRRLCLWGGCSLKHGCRTTKVCIPVLALLAVRVSLPGDRWFNLIGSCQTTTSSSLLPRRCLVESLGQGAIMPDSMSPGRYGLAWSASGVMMHFLGWRWK